MKMGFPHDKILISVGVQKMVDARAAGVMFTLNPTNGDPSKVVIEGNWGLGETVVSGICNPDKFVVDKVIMVIERMVSLK
jgi:pyruvate,water dikinase